MSPVDEDILELFRVLGAGRLGAKIYCALLSSGQMTLSRLSEETGIVAPQLYQYLKRLETLGLIEVSRGKPNLYRAVSPDVLEAVYKEKLERVGKRALEKLRSMPRRVQADERSYGVFVLRSWRSFRARVLEEIKTANYDILMCGDSAFMKGYWDELEEKEKKGVNVYVILYEVPGIPLDEKAVRVTKVRRAVSGDIMAILDSKVALVAQRRIGPRDVPEYGLVVEEPVLVDYLEHEFFHRWLRGEVLRDSPLRLPSVFTVHRLAALEIRELLSKGRKLRATVYGRFVGTKNEAVLEGVVTGVTLDEKRGVTHLTLETPTGTVRVGGPDAILEEFAAYRVEVREVYG